GHTLVERRLIRRPGAWRMVHVRSLRLDVGMHAGPGRGGAWVWIFRGGLPGWLAGSGRGLRLFHRISGRAKRCLQHSKFYSPVWPRRQKAPQSCDSRGFVVQPDGLRYYSVVPRRGLEPPRLSALVPETSASTNSAIWAFIALTFKAYCVFWQHFSRKLVSNLVS